jgi:hypothetical protein
MTYNQLINVFKNIADKHMMVNAFGFGFYENMNNDPNSIYTKLWVTPINSTVKENVIEYSFRILVYDVPHKDDSNKQEIWSDSMSICVDIYKILKGYYNDFTVVGEPVIELFEDKLADWVCGSMMVINIDVVTDLSECGIPTSAVKE